MAQVTLQCEPCAQTIICWCTVNDSQLLQWCYQMAGNEPNCITKQCGAGDGYYDGGVHSNAEPCEEEEFINSSLIVNTTGFDFDEIEVVCISMGSDAQKNKVIL